MNDPAMDDAWRIVKCARDHDWRRAKIRNERIGGHALEIHCGGRYHCDGALATPVAELFDCLLPLVAHDRPLVLGQVGQSLDGRTATESGASHYINGLSARTHLHRLRALVDAVLVGAGTAVSDRPRLTVRHVAGRNPARIVLDPSARVPIEGPLFQPLGAGPTLLLVRPGARPSGPGRSRFEVRELECGREGFDPHRILELLQRAGYRRVLVEGGGITVSRFVQAGALDRLHVMVAPMIIGSGRPGIALRPIDALDQAIRAPVRRFDLGEDTLFDLELARRNAGF